METPDAGLPPVSRATRIIAILLLAAFGVISVQQRLVPLAQRVNEETRVVLQQAALFGLEAYPGFLERVRASTKPGDTIALLFVSDVWDQGYAFGYYRASYVLSGREVLPLFDRMGRIVDENARRADYIAVFMRETDADPAKVIFSTPEGKLIRR